MRFFELAKEIGVGNRVLLPHFLAFAQSSNFEISNTLASIDDSPVIEWARTNRDQIVKHLEELANDASKKSAKISGRPFQKKNAAATATDAADKNAVGAKKSSAPQKKSPPKSAPDKNQYDKSLDGKKKPFAAPKSPPKKIEVPMPRPLAPVIPSGTVTITQDETAKDDHEIRGGIKHKRADFKTLSRPDLPDLFASGDGEYTRSLRTSGMVKRSSPSRGNRPVGGTRGKNRDRGKFHAERKEIIADPNATAQLTDAMTLRELSEALGVKLNQIIGYLMRGGQMVLANDILDRDTIAQIAEQFKIPYEWQNKETLEIQLAKRLEHIEKRSSETRRHARAPIITFMGHVDHGKTSLLDRIRSTRVVDTEHGGITQHIGAYTIEKNGQRITFLDTPGHEAFTQMRARGANITDIVVLVVAADDGVMPQTKEACAHAKNANTPIVVAINKCDIPGANPDRVRQELATQLELLPEAWGGKTGVVEVSAQTGQGIDELLERILLEAEILELAADPGRQAVGYVIEAKMTGNRGAAATVLIIDGTLNRGDVLITSNGYGKVRLMYNWNGEMCETSGPSDAVTVVGLNNVPEAGEKVYVVDDIIKARKLADEREVRARAQVLAANRRQHVSLENLMAHLGQEGKRREFNVIIKADVSGSLEVLQKTLNDLATDEVAIQIIHSGIGGISQADVILADASDALIVGFHVVADSTAKFQAATLNVQIKIYHVIYRLIEDLKLALEGLLPKAAREVVAGHAEIREVFRASKIGTIAGCYVTDGSVKRKCRLRLIRDSVVIYDAPLESLKRFKDDAREVRAGFECGIKIANYDDLRQGDIFEAYEIEEVARKLS